MPVCSICKKLVKDLKYKTEHIGICEECVEMLNTKPEPACRARARYAEKLARGMEKKAYADLNSKEEWKIGRAANRLNNLDAAVVFALDDWITKIVADPEERSIDAIIMRAEKRGLLRMEEGIAGYRNWENTVKQIRRRDKWACQACGVMDTMLDVHHIVYLSNHGTNTQHNLITLCRECHEEEHQRTFDDRYEPPTPEEDSPTPAPVAKPASGKEPTVDWGARRPMRTPAPIHASPPQPAKAASTFVTPPAPNPEPTPPAGTPSPTQEKRAPPPPPPPPPRIRIAPQIFVSKKQAGEPQSATSSPTAPIPTNTTTHKSSKDAAIGITIIFTFLISLFYFSSRSPIKNNIEHQINIKEYQANSQEEPTIETNEQNTPDLAAEREKLDAIYPGWRELTNSDSFNKWIDSQNTELRNFYANLNTAESLIKLIELYESADGSKVEWRLH